ncbi:MAG: hypothetical protein C4325_09325 [Blastocatellia bacterium]
MKALLNIFLLTVFLVAVCFAQQNLQVGQPAPAFQAQALDGKSYSLSELQGRVVVLTFWSTKCKICHSEIPKLNRVVDKYRGKDVIFLAITMESESRVEPYLKKNPFSYTILPNGFGVFLKYANISKDGTINMGFPSYFLINKRGAIELRAEGWDKAENLDNQISKLLMD